MSGGLPLGTAERPCERYRGVLSVCVSVRVSVRVSVTEIEILLSDRAANRVVVSVGDVIITARFWSAGKILKKFPRDFLVFYYGFCSRVTGEGQEWRAASSGTTAVVRRAMVVAPTKDLVASSRKCARGVRKCARGVRKCARGPRKCARR